MSALIGRRSTRIAALGAACFLAACATPVPPAQQSHATPQLLPTPAAAAVPLRIPGLMKDPTGLRPADIVAVLGPPDLRRDEPPAELWQYRAPDCVLSLFFYRGPEGYRLMRAETWQRSFAGSANAARCRDDTAPVKAHLRADQSSL